MSGTDPAHFPSPTGVIFDFDGTLAYTEEAVVRCARQSAIDLLGKADFEDKDVRQRMGLPLAQVFLELGAPDFAFGERLAAHYRQIFDRFAEPITLYPQVREYLEALRERGYPLAIASSRGVESLRQLSNRLEISAFFASIIGEEDPPRKKPFPDPAIMAAQKAGFEAKGAWMIGDTTFDMEMGAQAGCFCVGVTHGSHDHARLKASHAHAVFDDYTPLLQHLPAPRA